MLFSGEWLQGLSLLSHSLKLSFDSTKLALTIALDFIERINGLCRVGLGFDVQ